MARLDSTIDVEKLPEAGDFSALEPGWYSCTIIETSLENTKSGTGQYIKLKFQVEAPIRAGAVFWGNLNIRNDSEKAEHIGRQQLRALCESVGLRSVSDTDDLLNRQMDVKVKLRPAEGVFKAQNEPDGFDAWGKKAGKVGIPSKPGVVKASVVKASAVKAKPSIAPRVRLKETEEADDVEIEAVPDNRPPWER